MSEDEEEILPNSQASTQAKELLFDGAQRSILNEFHVDESRPSEKIIEDIAQQMRLATSDHPRPLEPPSIEVNEDDLITEGSTEIERYWISEPLAYISIMYDKKNLEYVYNVCEPELSPPERDLLERLFRNIRDILIRSHIYATKAERKKVLTDVYKSLLSTYGIKLSKKSFDYILYYLERNYLGYGLIDVIMHDDLLEDISCNGVNEPVYLFHRKYQNIKSNVIFREEYELNSMVTMLVQRGGRHISYSEPISNTTLPDGSRLEATLGREVTTMGSSFSIRKFRSDPFTPIDLIKYNTMSSEVLAYLWLAIENNNSLIFAGGTASGKTSSLNAVSLFIPQGAKVITIEDTRELMLYHNNWLASVTREGPTKQLGGEIDMYELLRAALRQRPEYIIVGEVRGKEAMTMFQAMNTGHTTYSTMHAGSIQAVVNRLLNNPINVPNMMLQALNIVCIQELINIDGKKMRRTRSIVEITGIDPRTNNLRINQLYKWDSLSDTYESQQNSHVLATIADKLGWSNERLALEMKHRIELLDYLTREDLRDYKSVGIVAHLYSVMPEKVLDLVKNNKLADIIRKAR